MVIRVETAEVGVTSTLFIENDPAVEALLTRRRQLGLDGRDEVWEGVYHVAPNEHARNADVAAQVIEHLGPLARRRGLVPSTTFNLGEPRDFRVPDLGLHRQRPNELYCATAAVVVEVRSPRDETFAKFAFYAAHGVEEVWVLEPLEGTVRIWQLQQGAYAETSQSGLLGLTAGEVEQHLDWPES